MADSDLASRGLAREAGNCEIPWASNAASGTLYPPHHLYLMAVMAWFKKERKPRTSQRERLEIPADAWEKCDKCGHIDIREKFEKALNVCPECGWHRRISAEDYIEILTDPGTWRELYGGLRSVDPLGFENYADRLKVARQKGGEADAVYTGTAKIDGLLFNLAVMNFAFMGGSMGSVVGEKIARLARRSVEKKIPLVIVSTSGGARMQEGVLVPDADGQDLGGHRPAATATASPTSPS